MGLRVVLILSLVVLCCSCEKPATSRKEGVFEFSSGGAYHPQGFGEWKVRLTTAGAFSVVHNVQGKEKDYGTFHLTDTESAEMWKLVDAADLWKIEAPKRPGVPDEVQYAFLHTRGNDAGSINIWVNDARQNGTLMAIVEQIAVLIEKYAKSKPVMK